MLNQQKFLWLVTAVLLLMFGLGLTSLADKSPTFDEQGFIVRGLGYLRGENRHMRVGHPLGLNALSAALLVDDPSVRLPVEHPSWGETGFHQPAELFLWEIGNNVEHIIFLARLPTLWLAMLMATVAGRWAMALSGARWAGLLALAFVALDPNVLASGRLATTDLGLAALALLAGYTLWRWLLRPTWLRAVLAGAALGLLLNTKFTALLFLPLFGVVFLIALVVQGAGGKGQGARTVLACGATAFLTLWASYGFQFGTLPADLPAMAWLGGRTVPLAHYLEQLLDLGGRMGMSTPSFLLGDYSDSGWWYYFPVAFVLKTPLATLALIGWAGVLIVLGFGEYPKSNTQYRSRITDYAALLIPSLGYFAIALTSDINLGYRHLLPVLPFLIVFAAVVVVGAGWRGQRTATAKGSKDTDYRSRITDYRIPALLLTFWLLITHLTIYPHYLAYFNLLAGGPENGWRALVDSNIDWGQDLVGLAEWMEARGVEHVWLSYFGEARPEYYGISYTGLPSFPPRLMNPEARPFYPYDPAPGLYAISASNLQGVLFEDHDLMAWFREREPLDKVGYSIFLYEVPARGQPAALALSGVQLDEINPADYALLGTNGVTPRWFDAAQALLLPDAANCWLALGEGVTPHRQVAGLIEAAFQPPRAGQGIRLYQADRAAYESALESGVAWDRSAAAELTQGEGRIAYEGFALEAGQVAPGAEFELTTRWRQLGRPQPVSIFVHLIGPDEQIVSQWDGLGAAWEGWRQGDRLVQIHRLTLPADSAGPYRLYAGLYYPQEPLPRWQSATGDRILLGEIVSS